MEVVEHIQREMLTRKSFWPGGMTHHLTMEKFSIALGVYLPQKIEDLAYRDLVYTTREFDYPSLWRQYSLTHNHMTPAKARGRWDTRASFICTAC